MAPVVVPPINVASGETVAFEIVPLFILSPANTTLETLAFSPNVPSVTVAPPKLPSIFILPVVGGNDITGKCK